MPSWFKKVFKDAAKPVSTLTPAGPGLKAVAAPPSHDNPALGQPDFAPYEEEARKIRRVVNAPILVDESELSSWSEEVRIKVRVEKDMTSATLMVDRPVLDGLSAWLPGPEWANDVSPLATELFKVNGVGSVLLHGSTVTITLAYGATRPWDDLAAEVGAVLRDYLKSGKPVVTKAFLDHMPPEEEVRRRVQSTIDMEINPGIAAHSGVVTLERVEGNTVYITMGGGCQGCAASAITLRQGIHTAFRQSVPQIGAIYDETDHKSGVNPYFKELPAGMA